MNNYNLGKSLRSVEYRKEDMRNRKGTQQEPVGGNVFIPTTIANGHVLTSKPSAAASAAACSTPTMAWEIFSPPTVTAALATQEATNQFPIDPAFGAPAGHQFSQQQRLSVINGGPLSLFHPGSTNFGLTQQIQQQQKEKRQQLLQTQNTTLLAFRERLLRQGRIANPSTHLGVHASAKAKIDPLLIKELDQFNDEFQSKMEANSDKSTPSIYKFSRYFPMVLYKLLMEEKYKSIIDWCPGGKSCVIYDIDQFEQLVAGNYFAHCNIDSFIKQLRRYNFFIKRSRILEKDHDGSPSRSTLLIRHEHFVKGEDELCAKLCHEKGKTIRSIEKPRSNSTRGAASTSQSPTTYCPEILPRHSGSEMKANHLEDESKNNPISHILANQLSNRQPAAVEANVGSGRSSSRRGRFISSRFSGLRTSLIEHKVENGNKSKGQQAGETNIEKKLSSSDDGVAAPSCHPIYLGANKSSSLDTLANAAAGTYQLYQEEQQQRGSIKACPGGAGKREMAINVTNGSSSSVLSQQSLTTSWKYNRQFPMILYKLLVENHEKDKSIIDWSPDGTSFVIKDVNRFENELMAQHFMSCNIESFQRQMRRYRFTQKSGRRLVEDNVTGTGSGVSRIARTLHAGHDYFIRGEIELCFLLCDKSKKESEQQRISSLRARIVAGKDLSCLPAGKDLENK